MKVGVLCEESGVVRDAFAARGHDAWSCDILPRPGKHLRGDCLSFDWSGFDLLVCFPPCTHLAVSGARHFSRKRRLGLQQAAVAFVLALWALPVACLAIENPVGVLSSLWIPPTQIIHPWQHGHGETKATCLWLRGLPPLEPTNIVEGRHPRVWLEPPGPKRARNRSKTYAVIAAAMAEQWGALPVRSEA